MARTASHRLGAAALLLGLCWPGGLAAQETYSLFGRARDAATGDALAAFRSSSAGRRSAR